MSSLKEALDREVGLFCRGQQKGGVGRRQNEQWRLKSVRLAVLAKAADLLRIPFDPIETLSPHHHHHHHHSIFFWDRRMVLSPDTFQALDEAWCRVCPRPTNTSNQERRIREKLFFHAPHYAERAVLSKFVHLLAKRDTAAAAAAAAATAPLLKTTTLNALLAVDGFRGILPHQCRLYIGHLSDRLPNLEKRHVRATRALYDESGGLAACYGGTTAAGLVLLALLKVYWKRVGSRMDRDTRSIVRRARECVRTRIRGGGGGGEGAESIRSREKKLVKKLAARYCRLMQQQQQDQQQQQQQESGLDALAFRKLTDYGKEALAKYLP